MGTSVNALGGPIGARNFDIVICGKENALRVSWANYVSPNRWYNKEVCAECIYRWGVRERKALCGTAYDACSGPKSGSAERWRGGGRLRHLQIANVARATEACFFVAGQIELDDKNMKLKSPTVDIITLLMAGLGQGMSITAYMYELAGSLRQPARTKLHSHIFLNLARPKIITRWKHDRTRAAYL